jgi:hypothetical protein
MLSNARRQIQLEYHLLRSLLPDSDPRNSAIKYPSEHPLYRVASPNLTILPNLPSCPIYHLALLFPLECLCSHFNCLTWTRFGPKQNTTMPNQLRGTKFPTVVDLKSMSRALPKYSTFTIIRELSETQNTLKRQLIAPAIRLTLQLPIQSHYHTSNALQKSLKSSAFSASSVVMSSSFTPRSSGCTSSGPLQLLSPIAPQNCCMTPISSPQVPYIFS